MSGQNIDMLLSELNFQETKDLKEELSKRIKAERRKKVMTLTVYVRAEYRDSFEIARQWAHEKGLTKRPSKWAFAQFAITNTIKMILEEIERERIAALEEQESAEGTYEPEIT